MTLAEYISLIMNLAALPLTLFCMIMLVLTYRLVKSPAIMWLGIAMGYGFIVRITMVLQESGVIRMPLKYWGAGVYIFLGIGIWQLYWMMWNMLKGNGHGVDAYRVLVIRRAVMRAILRLLRR